MLDLQDIIFIMVISVLWPFALTGIEFLYKFNKYDKFETKKYRYWRERKIA